MLKQAKQSDFQRHLNLGKCWIAREEYQRAETELTQAIMLASTDVERIDALYHRSYALVFTSDMRRASEDLQRITSLDGGLDNSRKIQTLRDVISTHTSESHGTQMSLF